MVETEDNPREYIKSRTELSSPNTDWELIWRRARLKGLGSEVTSFLWKLLHKLLPTEQRVARIIPTSSEYCKMCPTPTTADLNHCFFECISTRTVGRSLLSAVKLYDLNACPTSLLHLEFEADGANEMPLVWVTGQVLLYMWGIRASGKVVDLFVTRSVLESRVNLLRETRFRNETTIIQEIFDKIMYNNSFMSLLPVEDEAKLHNGYDIQIT